MRLSGRDQRDWFPSAGTANRSIGEISEKDLHIKSNSLSSSCEKQIEREDGGER